MVSDDEARSAAQEILSRHEFTRWAGDFDAWLRALEALIDLVPAWLIDFLSWLQEILIEILGAIGRFLGFFGVFGESAGAIGWLTVLVLLSVAIVLAYRVWGSSFFASDSTEAAGRPTRTHWESIAEAKALAAKGRFLEAAHRVQLATLAMLIEFDWLELARSDPNRTLRQRVAESALPGVERSNLVALVDRLETLWFDEPREDRELFEEWLALDDRLFRLATGGAR